MLSPAYVGASDLAATALEALVLQHVESVRQGGLDGGGEGGSWMGEGREGAGWGGGGEGAGWGRGGGREGAGWGRGGRELDGEGEGGSWMGEIVSVLLPLREVKCKVGVAILHRQCDADAGKNS